MARKRALERQLAGLASFAEPRVDLEQYPTPAALAATIVHRADLHGDLARPVVDLGTGTGVLALGTALRGAPRIVGLERDPAALEIARANERSLEPPVRIDWLLADAVRHPLALAGATVVMNPPFGAQRDRRHADREFLETVAKIAAVSYSVHNADSRGFVEAFVADRGGSVTHAFEATIELDRQFPFHRHESAELAVEVYRIEWAYPAGRPR